MLDIRNHSIQLLVDYKQKVGFGGAKTQTKHLLKNFLSNEGKASAIWRLDSDETAYGQECWGFHGRVISSHRVHVLQWLPFRYHGKQCFSVWTGWKGIRCMFELSGVMEMIAKLKRGRKICVDQGFPRTGLAFDILVGSYSKKSVTTLSPRLLSLLLAFAAVYVSLRQASEWGMRSLQASFQRQKRRLPSNSEKRKLVILSIILIHNLRTELVGLYQIATVFNPEYDRYINLGTYDRISRHYYQVDQYE